MIFVALVLIHVLALTGFVAWLHFDGRLNAQRSQAVVDIFRHTIAQEALMEDQTQQEAAELAVEQARDQRMQAIAGGPEMMGDRIAAEQDGIERMGHLREEHRRSVQARERQLRIARQSLAGEQAKLDEERRMFEQRVAKIRAKTRDEDFKMAVRLLEAQNHAQAKAMLESMLKDGKAEQVVDYLAAMQPRTAAKVLGQFKDGGEISTAIDLIERLRQRGAAPVRPTRSGTNDAQAPGSQT